MKINLSKAGSARSFKSFGLAAMLAMTQLLVACGGGGVVPNASNFPLNASPVSNTVLFDSASLTTSDLTPSGSGAVATVTGDPVSGLGQVVKVIKAASASPTAGTTLLTTGGKIIPFTSNEKTLSLRVWSATVGTNVRIRVEEAGDATRFADAEAVTTTYGWQTLNFNFASVASSLKSALAAGDTAPPLNLAFAYKKVTVFFNYGLPGSDTDGTFHFNSLSLLSNTAAVAGLGARPLSAELLARKAVNYSPYRNLQGTVGDSSKATDISNEVITDEMVLQDLQLLQRAGYGVIRIFNSNEKVAQRTLQVISNPANKLDMKVYLGMWMTGFDEANNQAEMAYGVALANSFPDIVLAVSVGNESLVSWSGHRMKPKVLAANIAAVRSQIRQPVTTDDNWAYFAEANDELLEQGVLDAIDFAAVHTYAMVDTHYLPEAKRWDWTQLGQTDLTKRAAAMMDAAMVATKKDYAAARANLNRRGLTAMPIVIGETGWMAVNPSNKWYTFLAHPVNQKMYLDRLTAWANEGKTGFGPKNVFYFEAFDEPWKGDDNGWGLFNVKREARYSVQSLQVDGSTISNCTVATSNGYLNDCKWKYEPGTYTDANALYFKPPTLNPAETQAKFVIHSEAVTGYPPGMQADAYESGTFTFAYPALGDSTTSDLGTSLAVSNYLKLSAFAPKVYGWGLLWQSNAPPPAPAVTANMSNYANGTIRFSIKTSYVGKLRVGISSDTEFGGVVEANLIVASGQFGYCTNTTAVWCDVSIPLSAFKTVNPQLDLRYILTRFSIADIFTETGNVARTGMPEIRLDNIYWSK